MVKKFSGLIFLHRFSLDQNFSAIRLTDVADRFQGRGFSCAVSANNGKQGILRYLERDSFQYIRRVFFVTEPDFFYQNCRIFYFVRICGDLFLDSGNSRRFFFKHVT